MASETTHPGHADRAVQAGLDKVGLRLLEQHAAHCVIGPDDPEIRAAKTSEVMAAVARLMGRG